MMRCNVKEKNFSLNIFLKAVMTVAMPIALQNLLGTTASMVDTIMIGTQGELAVAAVGICSQISSLFFACYFGFASGALLFFAQFWGARNEKGINKTFGISFVFMLAVALIFGGICAIRPQFILGIYTDKSNIIAIAKPYIRIMGFVYPVQVMGALVSFLMRSTERVKAPLFCSIISIIVNFCLNWLLINGNWGAPKMGAAGAAVGTLVSAIVNLIALFIFLVKSECEITLRIRDMFQWGNGFLKLYLGKCFPILCNEIFYGLGQMLINIVIGHQVETAIAAMAAFRVLEGFVYAFFGGLADASSVVVGQEVGAGNHMRGYKYVKGFAVLCPVITFTIVLICVIFNQPLLGLFGLGAEALNYGKYMLMIYLVMGAIRTCNYIMNVCYRAGGEAIFGTVLEIVCLYTISVPATWVSGMILHMPFLAVFAFVYTDEILRLIFEIRYLRTGKWVKPVTEEGIAGLPEFKKELEMQRNRK